MGISIPHSFIIRVLVQLVYFSAVLLPVMIPAIFIPRYRNETLELTGAYITP